MGTFTANEPKSCAGSEPVTCTFCLCRPSVPIAQSTKSRPGELKEGASGATFCSPVHQMNTRPRKYLNWATPLEVFTQLRHHSPVALGT